MPENPVKKGGWASRNKGGRLMGLKSIARATASLIALAMASGAHCLRSVIPQGRPHGENARLTQRFRLLSPTGREAAIRIEDAGTCRTPWTTRLLFGRLPGNCIREDVCLEREGLVGKY